MSQHRNAAGLQNQLDSLHGRHLFPRNKVPGMIPYIFVKRFRHIFYCTLIQKIFGIVGSGNDGARKCGEQFFIRNIDARALQIGAHFPVAFYAGVHKSLNPFPECAAFMIDIQSYDVNIFSFILRRKFNAGDHFDRSSLCGVQCLVQSLRRVVVGQGESFQSLFHRIIHESGRSETAVRFIGVYM